MAGSEQYENQYRKYLQDENDVYQDPNSSFGSKIITGAITAGGLFATGRALLKRGHFQETLHDAMLKAGQFRKGKVDAAVRGVRSFSSSDDLDKLGASVKDGLSGSFSDAKENLGKYVDHVTKFPEYVKKPIKEAAQEAEKPRTSQLVDSNIEAKKWHDERVDATKKMLQNKSTVQDVDQMNSVVEDAIAKSLEIDAKKQKQSMKETGFRLATMDDLIRIGEVSETDEWVQNSINSIYDAMKNKTLSQNVAEKMNVETDEDLYKIAVNTFKARKADSDIYIDLQDNIADFRDFKSTFNGFVNSLTTEFTIPIVKINPLRMFYIDQFFSGKSKPLIHVSTPDKKNPIVTGHNGSQEQLHLFVNGDVYKSYSASDAKSSEGLEHLGSNFFLAEADRGPVARLMRNLSGISISAFKEPAASDSLWKKTRYNVQSALDIGFQDEPPGQFDLFDFTSWVPAAVNKATNKLRMSEYIQRDDYLTDAFGKNADYIYMRRAKSLDESDGYKDFLSQFSAGRENMDKVTVATLFPYGFFERLNATLNQINLGLSNKALSDAPTVFGNLLLKRIAPLWVGVEMWDYVQYESENLLGVQLEDQIATTYANSSIEMARLRDNLGITDWAKGISPLIVGGEQIADIPFLGDLLDWNDTAEETKDFWEDGEVAVRKGRWWPLGNTPYTGSSIDYFQPNWVRRTLSDYEYTDSLYGSREEYFENTWMPTLRHPLAPIRHFVTDPYHYEIKHYEDRPYMMTGGIPEIENFPLIGPFLNATVGQILKPQISMHADEWANTPAYVSSPEEAMLASGTITEAPVNLDAGGMYNSLPMTAGVGSITAAYQQEALPVYASYVTSSGSASVMQTSSADNIYNLIPNLNERTPSSTGKFVSSRFQEAGPLLDDETPNTVASAYSMLGNLHYNMGEMGGFYGFMMFSAGGEIGDTTPVIQSSSDMTGYTRQFWDNDFGGFGSDANEIFRRFLPADRKLNEINTIDNTMPEWLPGSNYFIDFQSGDPYTKIKKGEMRLPGEGYERLYGIDSEELMALEIGASFIGYDDQKIRDHMLLNDAIKDESLNKILDKGTAWHKGFEAEMKTVAESTEQYVKDESVGIGGFYDAYGEHDKMLGWLRDNSVEFTYYKASDGSSNQEQFGGYYEKGVRIDKLSGGAQEAFYEQLAQYGSHTLIDPKTRSQKRYDEDEMHFENAQQVNFYGNQMGTDMNYLIHVSRDNPDLPVKVFAFETNEALLDYSYEKVDRVRQGIYTDIDNGDLHRGNLYEMIDRYRILADAAPYSQEFRDMKSQIKNMNLSEEEMAEVRVINDQVTQRKEKVRLYPYRFETANVVDEVLTVDHIIDANTFMAKEFPDNPISLAGVRVSTDKDNPMAQDALGIINKAIKEGGKVSVQYDANESSRVKDNTYKTIDAVVYDQKGRNLNRLLIDEGYGTEKEDDYTPAAVHARFSENEIRLGAMWENIAHMDTMIHTKMLQVRSPIESYERREVYGKDWQEWNDPVDDFLLPFIQNSAMHNPAVAIGLGAFIGAAFGSLKPTDVDGEGLKVQGRFGKVVGATLGASVMGAAVLNRMIHEAVTGERWIPERREEERDVEEYFDVLKYIKNNALYNQYAEIAMREENFDVKEYLKENEKEGDFRQSKKKDLEEIKRRLYMAKDIDVPDILKELNERFQIQAENRKQAMSLINAEIEKIGNDREMQMLGPNSAKAIMYKQNAEKTMYGYDPGDPVSNILAALPKKDRDYLMPFIESPESEHERILQTVPDYMKRVLQSAWGQKPDEKKDLFEYFKDKPLPGAGWAGWRENVQMDDMKVKFVDNAGLDPSEFDIWDSDIERARQIDARAPDALASNVQTDPQEYARKLKEILLGYDVQGVQVNVVQSNVRGISVDMDIDQNRQDDVQALINSEGYRLF